MWDTLLHFRLISFEHKRVKANVPTVIRARSFSPIFWTHSETIWLTKHSFSLLRKIVNPHFELLNTAIMWSIVLQCLN